MKWYLATALGALLLVHGVLHEAAAKSRSRGDADKPEVRQELVKPLMAAQQSLRSEQYQQALDQLAAVEASSDAALMTDYEKYVIDRMRGSAALQDGKDELALSAYSSVLQSKYLPSDERVPTLDSFGRLSYQNRNYAAAVDALEQYKSLGGSQPESLQLLAQALYQQERYKDASDEQRALIERTEKAGKIPEQAQIQLLASCALKRDSQTDYLFALRKMVAYYPEPAYWVDLIARSTRRPDFPDRLMLDVYRLHLATDTLDLQSEYLKAVQYALQEGLPAEANTIMQKGYAEGVLGTGALNDVSRQHELRQQISDLVKDDQMTLESGRALAAQQASGEALIRTGLDEAGFEHFDQGIASIKAGLAKGGLDHPDEAMLHLGYAYFVAGRWQEAIETFSNVQDHAAAGDLAQLWILVARQRLQAKKRS